MPDYVTVYQISNRSPTALFIAIGLLPVIVSLALLFILPRFGRKRPWMIALPLATVGIGWLFLATPAVLNPDLALAGALSTGQYTVTEGVVTDFHPMPYGGHDFECFSVNSVRFCYSDYVVQPGFHNTASHGGPIRDGLPVRVAHQNGIILRLQIPRRYVLTEAQSRAIENEQQKRWVQEMSQNVMHQRISLGFYFAAACTFLWCNVYWRAAMRFWLRPPYRKVTERVFRVLFALWFLSSAAEFARSLYRFPFSRENVLPTIGIAAAITVIVACMIVVVQSLNRTRQHNG